MSRSETTTPALWVEDSFGGGAYFYEGGALCHAPKKIDGTFDWEYACGVDRERCDPEVQVCIDKGIADLAAMKPRPHSEHVHAAILEAQLSMFRQAGML